MDRPCRTSWTGAHENFQAEEYDVGASLTHQVNQRGAEGSWTTPAQILKHLDIVAPLLDEVIHKEAHLYCKGDLEPLSSHP